MDNNEGNQEFKVSEQYEPKVTTNNRKSTMLKTVVFALLLSFVGGIVGGTATYFSMKYLQKNNTNDSNINSSSQPVPIAGDGMNATTAYAKVAPAVVVVSTKSIDTSGLIPREGEGIGSGFIINEEGYILTNYHVVKGAQEVTVMMSDKKEVKAKLINFDEAQDVAMIKIVDKVQVPGVVKLGDSELLQPGEEVIAIGTPLGKEFSYTVTKGIVSAMNRKVSTGDGNELNLVQTDTAINPGNSGGPLVNMRGEVVGINTLKLSGEAEGMGFAIPINDIKGRIGALSKPVLNLGVMAREVTKEMAKEQDGLEEGLYIVEVVEFSPAEKAGLKPGDIIVEFDGKDVKTMDQLKSLKESKNSGDKVSVKIIRDSKKKNLELILKE